MAIRNRLDTELASLGLVTSRSQAENYIKLGKVFVNGKNVKKSGYIVRSDDKITISSDVQYVSRAGMKLASVAGDFKLDFNNKIVLDVGSSTGGFTDYALKNGAKYIVAVDVGTNQLHPSLRGNSLVELHEQTDIRSISKLSKQPDIVVIDVSFISLRDVLPKIFSLVTKKSTIVAMVKPQFEAQNSNLKHKGVIKNEAMRRDILKDFENWCKNYCFIENKKDSSVLGEKGNTERFYVLRKT